MVLPKLLTTQMVSKHEELVQQLQQEARMLFYDRMMYEINDSLTSILAVCDVEGKEAIPKIKKCIDCINQSLKNTKHYQNNFAGKKRFDISLVLRNLVRVIKDNIKESKIACLLSDIKAPAQGDQAAFEELFLHLFVNMFSFSNNPDFRSEAIIELRQRGQDAVVTILKESHQFSEETLKKINKIKKEKDFVGDVRINTKTHGVEVIILVPLQFQVVEIDQPSVKSSKRHLSGKSKTSSKKSVSQSIWENYKKKFIFPGFAY